MVVGPDSAAAASPADLVRVTTGILDVAVFGPTFRPSTARLMLSRTTSLPGTALPAALLSGENCGAASTSTTAPCQRAHFVVIIVVQPGLSSAGAATSGPHPLRSSPEACKS